MEKHIDWLARKHLKKYKKMLAFGDCGVKLCVLRIETLRRDYSQHRQADHEYNVQEHDVATAQR